MKEKPKKKGGSKNTMEARRKWERKERIFVSKRLGFVRRKEGNEREIFGERGEGLKWEISERKKNKKAAAMGGVSRELQGGERRGFAKIWICVIFSI